MIFTLSITAFAAAPSENQLSQISDGFGIPMDVLADLDSETIRSLYEDVSTNKFFIFIASPYLSNRETTD